MLLDALQHSPILVQAFCDNGSVSDPEPGSVATIPFPLSSSTSNVSCNKAESKLLKHPCLKTLGQCLDIEHSCGFVTVVNLDMMTLSSSLNDVSGGNDHPENGRIEPEKADLLKEEVDSIADDVT